MTLFSGATVWVRVSRHNAIVCVLFLLWTPDREQNSRGGAGSEAGQDMNSWQGTGCQRCKGQGSLCVSEQEWGADIQVYLSVSPGLWEWVTEGAGQPGPSELFCLSSTMGSCLIQIRFLSVTFPSLIFCHFCLRGQSCVRPAHAPPHECLCVCFRRQIVISSQVELSPPLPSFTAMPPSCHIPLHTADIFREWQIKSLSRALGGSASAPKYWDF